MLFELVGSLTALLGDFGKTGTQTFTVKRGYPILHIPTTLQVVRADPRYMGFVEDQLRANRHPPFYPVGPSGAEPEANRP